MSFKKISTFIILILAVLLLADFCFAQRGMEVPLPQMEATELPFLPEYVKYIFNFAIGIAGLVAFICIVFGGVRYLTSAGNPTAMSDANDQIFSGLIGLIVILGSWLLLTTINPQLIVLSAGREPTPPTEATIGVYLCKDATEQGCQIFTESKTTIGDLNNKVKYVKFENPDEYKYGVVLHEDKDHKGNCAVCLSDGCQSEISEIGGDGPSSIIVFIQSVQVLGAGVTIYDGEEYQDAKWGHIGPYRSEVRYNDINDAKEYFDNEASSVKIEGTYMALLFKNKYLKGSCLALSKSDPSLSNEGFSNNIKSFRVIFAQ